MLCQLGEDTVPTAVAAGVAMVVVVAVVAAVSAGPLHPTPAPQAVDVPNTKHDHQAPTTNQASASRLHTYLGCLRDDPCGQRPRAVAPQQLGGPQARGGGDQQPLAQGSHQVVAAGGVGHGLRPGREGGGQGGSVRLRMSEP